MLQSIRNCSGCYIRDRTGWNSFLKQPYSTRNIFNTSLKTDLQIMESGPTFHADVSPESVMTCLRPLYSLIRALFTQMRYSKLTTLSSRNYRLCAPWCNYYLLLAYGVGRVWERHFSHTNHSQNSSWGGGAFCYIALVDAWFITHRCVWYTHTHTHTHTHTQPVRFLFRLSAVGINYEWVFSIIRNCTLVMLYNATSFNFRKTWSALLRSRIKLWQYHCYIHNLRSQCYCSPQKSNFTA
jgi:hypothetical protein